MSEIYDRTVWTMQLSDKERALIIKLRQARELPDSIIHGRMLAINPETLDGFFVSKIEYFDVTLDSLGQL